MASPQTPYRNDIDGLKALAVLAVLVYHINNAWLASGFVGVSIFFVISGYLATRLVYPRLMDSNFSIAEFYNGRIKRLLPAYLLVLFFSWALANLLFPPEWDYVVFNRSLVSSLAFLSNIYLARGTIYFSPDVETKPLLHTWSLSLEMQFYFLFPILALALFRLSTKPKQHLSIVLLIIALLLVITWVGVPQLSFYQGYDYYLPHRRFVELLIGVAVGIWSIRGKHIGDSPTISAIALILLITTLFLPSEWYRSGISLSLLPCLLTGYLLLPHKANNIINKALGQRLLSSMGRMSYSIYLWHWPLLAFARYIYEDINALAIGAIVLATMLISYLSYRFVEQPIRSKPYSLGCNILCFMALPLTLVGLNQFRPVVPPDPSLDLAASGVINYQGQDIQGQGIIGDKQQKPNILIVGNSHCLELGAFFDALGKRERWAAYAISSYVSPYVLGFKAYNPSYNRYAKERNQIVQEKIESRTFNTIVMPADWGNKAYTRASFYTLLSKTLSMLESKGLNIYILNAYMEVDNPRYKEYHHRRMGLGGLYSSTESTDYKGIIYKTQKENLRKLSAYLAEHHPRVQLLDLSDLIPEDLLLRGKPIYRDEKHFNRHWAEHLASIYQSPWSAGSGTAGERGQATRERM